MKKIISMKSILSLSLLASTAFATSTQKTFLMPRQQLSNKALEVTTWNYLIEKDKYRNGANFEVTSFYQESGNATKLGKYFGVQKNNVIGFINGTTTTTKPVGSLYIIHDSLNTHSARTGYFKLHPEQRVYGFQLNYYQDLEAIYKGFYLKAIAPVINVKNDMDLSIVSADSDATRKLFQSYFAGNYDTISYQSTNLQSKLAAAKMGGPRDATGIADIEIRLGYDVLKGDDGHIGLEIGVVAPTSNTVEGEYLFEPIYGNGNHFALAAAINAQALLWHKNDAAFKFNLDLEYKYVREGTEKRTLGLNTINSINPYFSHYFLLGKESTSVDQPLIPAANVLTKDLKVTPGSQVELAAGFEYDNAGFTLDIGYNLYFKESEKIGLKDEPFVNENYGLSTAAYDTHANAFSTIYCEGAAWLTRDDLDLNSVKTPSYVTHKVYGGLGYIFKKWKQHVMIGIGGSYEFAQNNAQLENWAAWFKGGIAF